MSEMDGGGSTAAATTGSSSGGDAGASSAPAAPAPQTTADVASQVIDAFDQTDTNGVDATLAAPATADPVARAPKPPVDPAAPLSAEEILLQEFGFTKQYKPDGREYYIPRSKVLSMIGSGLKRGQEKWGQEKTHYESQIQQYQGHLAQLVEGVRGDPVAFLSELAQHDPRYAAFLDSQPLQPPQRRGAPPPLPYDDMPPPDLPLSDGSSTYSLDGIQKQLIPWLTQAIKASITKDLQAERQQAQQQKQQRQQLTQATRQKVVGLMQEATSWPLFGAISPDGNLSPFQAEVMQVFMADKSLDLRAAYMKVAHPRLTADRNKMREEMLKELNGAPRATATGHGSMDAAQTRRPLTTAEIAARNIDRMERDR